MKTLAILILALFLTLNLYCQDSKVEELVSEGTSLHDQGKYDEAIAKYKAALELNKNSPLANYEMSYTCFAAKKYDDAIKYSKKVIDIDSTESQGAYIVLGSSYDNTGDFNKAITCYKNGIKYFPKSNMLHYNLSLTYYNRLDYDNAEESVTNSILINPNHSSSHLLLATIMKSKGQKTKAILPLYYFLLKVPNTNRSKMAYSILTQLFGLGVEKSADNSIQVNLSKDVLSDKVFGPLDLLLSLNAANNMSDDNKDKTEQELFFETNKTIFSVIKESNQENKEGIWGLYIEKFKDLSETDNVEAFSYFISQSAYPDISKKWLSENPDKLEKLKNWMVQ
jgi:tetratricopeptide (TPR) repeat protein